MKTHNDIRCEYNKETGCAIYRKTANDTLVYDEEYVHWLERKKIANDDSTGERQLTIPVVSVAVCDSSTGFKCKYYASGYCTTSGMCKYKKQNER